MEDTQHTPTTPTAEEELLTTCSAWEDLQRQYVARIVANTRDNLFSRDDVERYRAEQLRYHAFRMEEAIQASMPKDATPVVVDAPSVATPVVVDAPSVATPVVVDAPKLQAHLDNLTEKCRWLIDLLRKQHANTFYLEKHVLPRIHQCPLVFSLIECDCAKEVAHLLRVPYPPQTTAEKIQYASAMVHFLEVDRLRNSARSTSSSQRDEEDNPRDDVFLALASLMAAYRCHYDEEAEHDQPSPLLCKRRRL